MTLPGRCHTVIGRYEHMVSTNMDSGFHYFHNYDFINKIIMIVNVNPVMLLEGLNVQFNFCVCVCWWEVLTPTLPTGAVVKCTPSWQIMVKSWEVHREVDDREEDKEEERQATGICFYSNRCRASGNKIPVFLKQTRDGKLLVKINTEKKKTEKRVHVQFSLLSFAYICSVDFLPFFSSIFLLSSFNWAQRKLLPGIPCSSLLPPAGYFFNI